VDGKGERRPWGERKSPGGRGGAIVDVAKKGPEGTQKKKKKKKGARPKARGRFRGKKGTPPAKLKEGSRNEIQGEKTGEGFRPEKIGFPGKGPRKCAGKKLDQRKGSGRKEKGGGGGIAQNPASLFDEGGGKWPNRNVKDH